MNYKIDRTNGEGTQFEIVGDTVEQEVLRVLKALRNFAAPQSAVASLAGRVDYLLGTLDFLQLRYRSCGQ